METMPTELQFRTLERLGFSWERTKYWTRRKCIKEIADGFARERELKAAIPRSKLKAIQETERLVAEWKKQNGIDS